MYTLVDTPELVAHIQKDLDLIVARLRDRYKGNLVSVLLCGGYGRGEGSVIDQDGIDVPYNDYDILIVTKRRVSSSTLSDFGEVLAGELGIRFVDLGAITRSRLNKMPQTVFVRDLFVSQLLWGDDVRGLLPVVNPETLPMEEARVLLRNRLICFFELTPEAFFQQKTLKEDAHRRLVLQLAKAGIAVHLASLIERGKYHSSYAQQMELVGDAVLRTAYEVKLGLKDPMDVDVSSFWFAMRDRYLSACDQYLDDGQAVEKMGVSMKENVKLTVKRLVYSERVVPSYVHRRVEFVVLNLLRAYPDQDELKEISLMALREWFEIDATSLEWFERSRVCDALWQKYHH
jgi:hypothetical protein